MGKLENTESIPSNFSNHSGMKIQIINRRNAGQLTNKCYLNNTVLYNQWSKEIKGKQKVSQKKKQKGNTYQIIGCNKINSKREVYNNKYSC